MLPEIALDGEFTVKYFLMEDLMKNNVKIYVNSKTVEIANDSVFIIKTDKKKK